MKDLNELYYYDETSPSCLRWAIEIFSGRWKNFKNVSVGDVAGSISKSGYFQVRRNGKLHLVHRIIWEMHNGNIPEGMFVDHIDGNKVNNNLENLRIVSRKGNARNSSTRKDNSSGVTGVSLCTNKLRSGKVATYWRVQWIDLSGMNKSKAFNIEKYGEDIAYSMAVDFRLSVMESLNKDGAGYTKRHFLPQQSVL